MALLFAAYETIYMQASTRSSGWGGRTCLVLYLWQSKSSHFGQHSNRAKVVLTQMLHSPASRRQTNKAVHCSKPGQRLFKDLTPDILQPTSTFSTFRHTTGIPTAGNNINLTLASIKSWTFFLISAFLLAFRSEVFSFIVFALECENFQTLPWHDYWSDTVVLARQFLRINLFLIGWIY